ncbi:hypothetical protein [Kineosporia sp. NBRC 101731]|uniref:hypothetical protein n=1 Tax=Kineosporia sp. NBRC 101731 TaxID=3032199 RepID=UPI0024A4CE94|nr:hypothetical protein [Kineosporia sp. NBRC 101731]GLY29483.1 hypothetical protein Kisp02_28480 [Kineosporia sp. NBRC 101731]
MEVRLVNDEVSLEPEVPGEVLIDVVNTDDVIDAVEIDLTGLSGATVRLESTPTLFPGERRRLPLQVQLPAQVPAGRHRVDVVVRATATEREHQAGLQVDVAARPALTAGVRPCVRMGTRRVSFPMTVANRGNTALLVHPREVDLPDGVSMTFEPDEAMIEPWQTKVCRVEVTAPWRLLGAVREHLADVRVVAASVTPGHPMLDEELHQDVRVTFRQRPVLGHGLVFAVVLVLVLAIWGTLGYLGLRAFVRPEAPPVAVPDGFRTGPGPRDVLDVALTLSGLVVSEVDGSPVSGVKVLACSQDPAVRPRSRCTEATTTYRTASDSQGRFWLPDTFPARYEIVLAPPWNGNARLRAAVDQESCRVRGRLPGRPAQLTVRLRNPDGSATPAVHVTARLSAPKQPSADVDTGGTPEAGRSPGVTVAPTPVPACGPIPSSARKPSATALSGSSAGRSAGAGTGAFEGARSDPARPAGPVWLPARTPTGKGEEGTQGAGPGDPAGGSGPGEFPSRPAAGGGWESQIRLTGLLAPGYYDLTMTVGGQAMHACRLHVLPARANFYSVPFSASSATCAGDPG